MNDWISVKEKLPEKDGDYLCAIGDMYQFVSILWFTKSVESVDDRLFVGRNRPGWINTEDAYIPIEVSHVSHWMELPELPPKGE